MLDRVSGRYVDNGPNARAPFGSASLVKLFITDSILQRARLGIVTLSGADRDRMALMLRSSDDAAASNLWSRFGGSSMVADVAQRYRLEGTTPPANPRYWGLTQVTARDLVVFYDGMLGGWGGLHPADRDFVVGQLRQATVHGTDGVHQFFGLRDGLPREPVIGIKQGWMCCFSDGFVWRHSTGIVGEDSRYVVVALARDPGGLGAAHTTASSTRIVQQMFPAGLVPRVHGVIGDRWYALGGHRSVLGLPTGNELPLPGGAVSRFERGSMYWTPAGGARFVVGAIHGSYARQGYERGRLGLPTGDEIALADGALSQFTRGTVYWSPASGAHWVLGDICRAYAALGSERGHLGYPTSDELPVPGGAVGHFQRGTMYWSPATGAHAVNGAIRGSYDSQGAQRGRLGFPTSDEVVLPGGAVSQFQRGTI